MWCTRCDREEMLDAFAVTVEPATKKYGQVVAQGAQFAALVLQVVARDVKPEPESSTCARRKNTTRKDKSTTGSESTGKRESIAGMEM